MASEAYKFTFSPVVSRQSVGEALITAVFAVECIHGQSAIRLDAAYRLDEEKRTCVVNAGTPVGRDIGLLLAGLLALQFGGDAFAVSRVAVGEVAA